MDKRDCRKKAAFRIPRKHDAKCPGNLLDEGGLQVSNAKKPLKCLLAKRKEKEIAWAFKTWKGFDCQASNNQRLYFVVKILVIQDSKEAYKDFMGNI